MDFTERFKANEIEQERFKEAVKTASLRFLECDAPAEIGRLAEKTIHATLKNYFAKPEEQEVKVGSFFADAKTAEGIFEIQTRQFYRMKRKLTEFLQDNVVCIVYPVRYKRLVKWIEPDTGEIVAENKWHQKDLGYTIFRELYGIREFLDNGNLRICLMYVESDEYKFLDGYGKDRKIRATRMDGVPTKLVAEVNLCVPEDFGIFLPEELSGCEFGVKEFEKAAHIKNDTAQKCISVLRQLGLVDFVRTEGKRNIFVFSHK